MRATLLLLLNFCLPLWWRWRGRVRVGIAALLLFEPALAALLPDDSVALLHRLVPLLGGALEDGAPLLARERVGFEVAAAEAGIVGGLGRQRRSAGWRLARLGLRGAFGFGLCAPGHGGGGRALL